MNTEFEIYKYLQRMNEPSDAPVMEDECDHSNTIIENGASLCIQCGVEVAPKIYFEKHFNGPTEAMPTPRVKTIYPDIEHMNISDRIKDIANDIYLKVCGPKTRRGSTRRSIIFASIFHAYKMDMNPQSCESLIKVFKIKRKDALNGLKFISENTPKDSPFRNIYIHPENLIQDFMKRFNASQVQIHEVVELYNKLKGKSSIFNRSRSQSTASGIIWYYMQQTGRNITLKEFTEKINLSELTINKITKEIQRVLNQ
jgi:transcription initiation factor TFIIIB Brf1 subunit/transcription initiation factor TFIIB